MDDRIYKTEDYSKFKKLLGNRDVTETRVRKIVNSIRENGYILSPICVNERSEIIDGQGRLEAQRRLKLPVYYYIAPGTGIKECVAMNRYTSKWTVMDFISSHADEGNTSYLYLLKLIGAYSDMRLNVVLNAVNGKMYFRDAIKSGEFSCTEEQYKKAVETLDYEKQFKPILSRIKGRCEHYYYAIGFCFSNPKINNQKLYKNFVEKQAELIPVANTEQAMRVIDGIYNFRNRQKVYIWTEYQEALDGKYAWYRNRYMGE